MYLLPTILKYHYIPEHKDNHFCFDFIIKIIKLINLTIFYLLLNLPQAINIIIKLSRSTTDA